MEKIYFREEQRFWDVWWIKLVMIGVLVIDFASKYSESGLSGYLTSGFLVRSLIPLGIIVLFYVMKLEVTIDAQGISYRFFPFHLKKHRINWVDVDAVYIRQYSPLGEYGGWGVRMGISGAGTAYNISGNMGLQVEMGKRRVLFGTRQPEILDTALRSLFSEGIIKGAQLADGGVALVH
jgi:hypothetical protein